MEDLTVRRNEQAKKDLGERVSGYNLTKTRILKLSNALQRT